MLYLDGRGKVPALKSLSAALRRLYLAGLVDSYWDKPTELGRKYMEWFEHAT